MAFIRREEGFKKAAVILAVLPTLATLFTFAASAHTSTELSRNGFVPLVKDEHHVVHERTGDEEEKSVENDDNVEHQQPKAKISERRGEGSYESTNPQQPPTPRFGSALVDGGNIELGLTLTAPFLNIPLTTGSHQYPGTGAYAPLKYDLGGLVLAGALAIGTIFLLPKFLPESGPKPGEFFNEGGYPGHGRSDFEKMNSVNQTTSAFGDILSTLDESLLSKYHIDSTACAYRIICTAIKTAKEGLANGKPTAVDSMVHIMTRTPAVKGYFPPAWREIAESAWTADETVGQEEGGTGCNDINMHKRCQINSDITSLLLGTLLPKTGFL